MKLARGLKLHRHAFSTAFGGTNGTQAESSVWFLDLPFLLEIIYVYAHFSNCCVVLCDRRPHGCFLLCGKLLRHFLLLRL